MQNSRKLSIGLLLILVLTTVISTTVMAEEKLVYWSMWNEGEPQQQVLARAVRDFEEEYGVTVEVNWVGRDVQTAIRPRLISGERIDIVDQSGSELYGAFVVHDLAGEMSDILDMEIPGENITVGEILEKSTYEAYYKDDSLFIIPYSVTASSFWYDKTLFNELGLETPNNWDEFLNVCSVLKDNGIDPIAYGLLTDVYVSYMPVATAVRIMGPGSVYEAAGDRTGEAFLTPEWERVAETIYTMTPVEEDLLMMGYDSATYPAPQMDWAMGLAGMFYCGSWIPVETRDAVGPDFEYGSFIFPGFDDKPEWGNAVEIAPFGYNVLKNSENPELANKLVTWVLKEEYARAWVEDTANMTPR